MPEEKEHWVSILVNSMTAKIIAFSLLGLLIIAVIVGLFTNKHVNILGIEFNGQDTVKATSYQTPDTVYIQPIENKIDTSTIIKLRDKRLPNVIVKNKVKPSVSDTVKTINQQNLNGDNNLNTGINNGNIGGYNNTVINERHLTEADKMRLFELIDEAKKQNHSSKNCFSLLSTTNSNGGKVSSEIQDALIKAGYTLNGFGTAFGNINGISIDFNKSDSCISIVVGVL